MGMSEQLKNLLALGEEFEASDIHLMVGQRPRFRIRGSLVEKGGLSAYDMRAVDALVMELGLWTLPIGCQDGTEKVRLLLNREGALDGALTSPAGIRYRFNIFCESSRHAIALRRLDSKFRSFSELGLPHRLEDFCSELNGLIVVTGATGSGKSTTLATVLDRINSTRDGHVITIEDPIEYVHRPARCFISQRQVGRDARSFNAALIESLRQDPDVILVGEIRDLDTIRTALRAAETGHLVFTTLHAGDCAGAVERLVSVFPSDEQNSIRRQLALVLRGIFAQRLLARQDGSGRCLACELLVNTPAVSNLIATGRTPQLYSQIETGAAVGMKTMDQSLCALFASGLIDERTALANSKNPEQLKERIRHAFR